MGDFFQLRWIILLALAIEPLATVCPGDTKDAIQKQAENAPSIEQLIAELGSDQYFLRRRAEQQLIQLGADAFDQLQAAEQNSDLEIATRVRYILHRIRIDWIRPGDSSEVRQVMARYGDLSKTQRLQRIEQLVALDADQGLGPLCRIARFEPSPRLARYAALGILGKKNPSPERATQGVAVLLREMGTSRRPPVQWLRTYCQQLKDPAGVVDRWTTLLDDEIDRLRQKAEDTEESIVYELLQLHLQLCRQAGRADAVFATLRKRIDLLVQQKGRLQDGLAYAISWSIENKQWEALELIEDHYEEAVRRERLLIYLVAVARGQQGRTELAEQFAQRAFRLEANDAEQRNTIADVLANLGRHDWAEREWRYVIQTFPVTDNQSVQARSSLASWRLHDRGEDKQAAQLLAEVTDALDANPPLKRRMLASEVGRYRLNLLQSQKEFYQACYFQSQGNYQEQRKHLEQALAHDQLDADVLIAMYHLQGADKSFRQSTLARIRRASKVLENRIQEDPDNPQHYNHWAWLISNTEGDYQKAVRYSLRSLELSPNSPSLLDTLGRCYYAAGDLDNAIKYQRQAVQRHPQVVVMRRQLEQFEREREQKAERGRRKDER